MFRANNGNKNENSFYHIDAFTNKVFSGNPAAVCLLTYWLSDEQLQAIAYENNVPTTVFIIPKSHHYLIRWYTMEESELCGHGSLAAAFVIFTFATRHPASTF